MRPHIITLLLSLSLASLTGCASIEAHTDGRDKHVYPGVRSTVRQLKEAKSQWWDSTCVRVMMVIDLPLSAIFDTLCLPCDIIGQAKASRSESSEKPSQ